MQTLIHKFSYATKWLNVIFLRRNSLNPCSGYKSLEIKETHERVSKTNEELIFVNKVAIESFKSFVTQLLMPVFLSQNPLLQEYIFEHHQKEYHNH